MTRAHGSVRVAVEASVRRIGDVHDPTKASMAHRTVPRFVLVSLCLCVLANFSWAQHGAGSHAGGGGFSSHAGGGFSSHASAGPSFGGQSGFHPAPSRVPGSFYGSPFSHRGPFAPYPFRGPGHLVRPNTGFQHFRSYSRPAAGPRVGQGPVPRSVRAGVKEHQFRRFGGQQELFFFEG